MCVIPWALCQSQAPAPRHFHRGNPPSGFHLDFNPTDPWQRVINQPGDATSRASSITAQGLTPLPPATCMPCTGTAALVPVSPQGCSTMVTAGPWRSPECSLGSPCKSHNPCPGKTELLPRHRAGSSWQSVHGSRWGPGNRICPCPLPWAG